MVVSHLNKFIDYLETREIEPEDIGKETDIYEIEIFNKNHYIALGEPKYTYATKYDVVYFPIYLLKGFRKIRGKIGVFEVEKDRLISIKDNITNGLGKPLFFEKTTEKYMEKTHTNVNINTKINTTTSNENEWDKEEEVVVEVEEKGDEDEDEEDLFSLKNANKNKKEKEVKEKRIRVDDIFNKDKIPPKNPSLTEETEEDSKKMREEYVKSTKDNWVQTMMQNKHFDIQRNEGGGDCFFAVIRDAFLDIGYHTSVPNLRLLLSQEVNSDLLKQSQDIYNGIVHGQEIDKHEMDMITKQNQNFEGVR